MSPDELAEQLSRALDPASAIPLYDQITAWLRQAIESGQLAPGQPLPTEIELARALGLGRQTVNHALSTLARRGLIVRRRGVGSFVAEPFIEQPLSGLYSFIRTLTAQGRSPTSKVLGYRLTVDGDASRLLANDAEALVEEISRLRFVDGEPFVLETIFIPAECGERIPPERLATEPLYDLLHELCDLKVTAADETLRPMTLERREAVLLGLTAGEPAFLVERTGYAGLRVVELRRSIVRGDRYRYRVHLSDTGLTAH